MPAPGSQSAEKHFAFGANWKSYVELVGDREIEQAKKGLLKLVPEAELRGRAFLDIGCGSGLHALAAAQLGISRIVAIDYDPDSADTAKALLERFRIAIPWRVERADLFDLDAAQLGRFDIVYSWGVLHHTGDMWRAIRQAASFVAPNGLLAVALYRSTQMDAFWKWEKRWYSQASPALQRVARALYLTGNWLFCTINRRSYRTMVENYNSLRGMDFHHDVHDWLGGYPYETALAPEVDAKLTALGFKAERVFAQPMSRGLLGSGCDEYVYRRQPV